MHPELEVLLQIQDLKSQLKELSEGKSAEIEQEQFQMNVDEARGTLAGKIEHMEAELSEPVRRRYARIARGYSRVVAPAIDGICYGCFVAIPTSRWASVAKNAQLDVCESCGRFLYAVA